jgi:hypothetical protein
VNGVEIAANRVRALTPDKIVRCFIVEYGSPLVGNDTKSTVIELFDAVLVLVDIDPRDILPSSAIDNLIATKRLLRAFAWKPPWRWTGSLFGIIPDFTLRSGIYSKQSLETARRNWKVSAVESEGEM